MKKILLVFLFILISFGISHHASATVCQSDLEFAINKQERQCAYFSSLTLKCNKATLPTGWEIVKLDTAVNSSTPTLIFEQKCESYGYKYINKDVGVPPFMEKYGMQILQWVLGILLLSAVAVGLYGLVGHIAFQTKLKQKNNLTEEDTKLLSRKVEKSRNIFIIGLFGAIFILIIWAIASFTVY